MQDTNPIRWAIRPFIRYIQFDGRSPRAEYWWFVLLVTITGAFLGFLDGALLGGPVLGAYGPMGLAFTVGIFIPSLAVTVRRLHDIERTGWWVVFKAASYLFVFTGLGPGLGSTVGGNLSYVVICLAIVCGFGGLLLFFFLITEGDGGPNRYGPDPYGPGELEEVFA